LKRGEKNAEVWHFPSSPLSYYLQEEGESASAVSISEGGGGRKEGEKP